MLVLVILQLIFPVISILHFLFIHPFRRRSTVNLKSTLVRLQLGALVPAFVANVGLVIESTLRAVYYFNPNLTALNLRWVPVYSYLGIYGKKSLLLCFGLIAFHQPQI